MQSCIFHGNATVVSLTSSVVSWDQTFTIADFFRLGKLINPNISRGTFVDIIFQHAFQDRDQHYFQQGPGPSLGTQFELVASYRPHRIMSSIHVRCAFDIFVIVGEHLPLTRVEQERMKSIFKRKVAPLVRKLTPGFGSTMQKRVDQVKRGCFYVRSDACVCTFIICVFVCGRMCGCMCGCVCVHVRMSQCMYVCIHV